MMQIAELKGLKNTNDLAKYLGYKSPEKLYRLERDPKAKPSVDILSDFSNMFENADMRWVITGREQAPEQSLHINDTENTYTPVSNRENTGRSRAKTAHSVSPTTGKNVSPTVSPTDNLGLPKVITINENQDEIISLVSVKAAAGYLNGYGDPEYIESLPTVRMPGLKGGSHRAFEVKGHSMSPTLYNSSIAIGRWVESLQDIRDRRIYIVVTKSEGIVVKRVINRIYQTGKLVLLSDNQNKRDYPNIILDPEDISELWYLRGAFIFEFPEPGELHNRFNDLEAKVTLLAAQMKQLQP